MLTTPHPEKDVTRRITTLENRHPDIMVWTPLNSVSGNWEAMGNGWQITEADPSRFCDELEKKLGVR